jgi:drug/metabolite transporter (DMT)-like permease
MGARPETKSTQAGWLAMLLGATGIGLAPLFVRWSEVGPSATAAFRVALAMPILWLWVAAEQGSGRSWRDPVRRADRLWLAMAGVCFAADLGLWHWSLRFTSVANSTLIINFTPVLVALGAWRLWGERLAARFWFGMGVAFGGLVLLLANSVDLGRQQVRGDMLALATTLFYGAYLLLVKRLRRSYSTAVVMAWSSVAMVPIAFLLAWAAGETLWPQSRSGWLMLLALALVSQAGGQALIAFGLGRLPASASSVTLLWQPVVAALAAWVFLGEPLSWRQAAGAVGVLLGIAVVSLGSGSGGKV